MALRMENEAILFATEHRAVIRATELLKTLHRDVAFQYERTERLKHQDEQKKLKELLARQSKVFGEIRGLIQGAGDVATR